MPVSHYTNDLLYPSSKITSGFRLVAGSDEIYAGKDFIYKPELKEFSLDLRQHIQGILIDQIPNRGVLIRPSFFNSTVERIVFNGPQGIYKNKPKLVVTYTTY